MPSSNQVKTIINQVILAVESILLFVLVAGFVVTLVGDSDQHG